MSIVFLYISVVQSHFLISSIRLLQTGSARAIQCHDSVGFSSGEVPLSWNDRGEDGVPSPQVSFGGAHGL